MTITELINLPIGTKIAGTSGNVLTVANVTRHEQIEAQGRDVHTGEFYSTLTLTTSAGHSTHLRSDDARLAGMIEKLQVVL